jgi:hypothetical protein
MAQISEFLKAMQEMMGTGKFCSCPDESWPQQDDGRNEGLVKTYCGMFPPVREPLKRGASKQACSSRRTSVYSSLLSNARNSRKSSHASPSVATQQ